MSIVFNPIAAEKFLKEATGMLGKDRESPIRHVLSAYLPQMFPGQNVPWWVKWHSKGSEKMILSERDGKMKRGFIDTLVGSTAIEYEKDLNVAALAAHGEAQVREYCAGLLNEGIPTEIIVGILSDTVRWRAFKIKEVLPKSVGEILFGEKNLVLELIEAVDLTVAGPVEAAQLGRFLIRHLGRIGGRILGADTLASDLGFESSFCSRHLIGIQVIVDDAFVSNPGYSSLIEKVWSDFVSYLGGSGVGIGFDRETYVGELYILTLAKLLCSNVLEGQALLSNDVELISILDGTFFHTKGFSNLVEYDYFGWLNQGGHVKKLLHVARDIQEDLAAYDFSTSPVEDLFGALMAQLARRSQRLLLGQEWTPAWIARAVVEDVLQRLPKGEDPRLVDMCCGSGTMIVETIKQTLERFNNSGVTPSPENLARVAQAITGFDIDPLAVMLAKVSWILAAKSWLDKTGAFDVMIPIYHADSLFASTPVSKKIDNDGSEQHELDLDGHKVHLPMFLVSPESAALFDALVSTSYGVAMEAAKSDASNDLKNWPEKIVNDAFKKTSSSINQEKINSATVFVDELLRTLVILQRLGRNGIWAYVLGNSYRPGLVTGSFNGLVSNPPWLAMSKVADNPYKETIICMAESFGIKPPGASHLHAEMATIFLLHAISRYLCQNAVIGCILPESVTSAHHHSPFRRGEYRSANKPIPFTPEELWRVESGTFKNEAIVIFGKKAESSISSGLVGKLASPGGLSSLEVYEVFQGNRSAWSNKPISTVNTGFFVPASFKQGADVFPRTAIFHDLSLNGERMDISPIKIPNSALAYLTKEAKNHKDFTITARGVDPRFFFKIFMSNHLTPFRLAPPATGFLPLENIEGIWQPASSFAIRAAGPSTASAFAKFFSVAGENSEAYFKMIDTPRRKLVNQLFPESGWLVVMGAGGKIVCAAYEDITCLNTRKLIIDQTLYWVVVPTEDEAIYLTGLLNSEAINIVIQQFQPRGQYGERHVHTLPLGVTPKFNPLETAHIEVVAKTRMLIEQWKEDETINPALFVDLLNLNSRLSNRRTKLRERLKKLPCYFDYDLACRSLYAV